jgi:hypothetical protein
MGIPRALRGVAALAVAATIVGGMTCLGCRPQPTPADAAAPILLDGPVAKAVVVAGAAFQTRLAASVDECERITDSGCELDADLSMYSVRISRDSTSYRIRFIPKRLFYGVDNEYEVDLSDFEIKGVVIRPL